MNVEQVSVSNIQSNQRPEDYFAGRAHPRSRPLVSPGAAALSNWSRAAPAATDLFAETVLAIRRS